jgi:hypothetical protein
MGSGWLIGWLVNLVKWGKIAISQLIWLKFGMDVPNAPDLKNGLRLFRLKKVIGWFVGWSIWLIGLRLLFLNGIGWIDCDWFWLTVIDEETDKKASSGIKKRWFKIRKKKIKKMVKIGFFAYSMLDAGPTMAILFAVPLKFGIYDSGFGIYWLWVLSSSILVIYIAENGQNSEKMVNMLIQGQCALRSRDFSIFLTPELDSLGQKT